MTMSIGGVPRSIFSASAPASRRCSRGFSITELCVCLGIVGVLSGFGASTLSLASPGLAVVQQDLDGALHQAFHQARAQGRNVQVALGVKSASSDVLPVELPRNVRWGKPASVPLPPGMDKPVVADKTGEAHASIIVTPRHTATATVWFLTDGKDVLCLRMAGHGERQMLRWRAAKGTWRRV
jgi:type II secretory pathway pseudopilin PulG